ncbi:MAG: porin [Paraburkholderia sp.]|nr:MAG: porin [Paraburkholderia sp.]TAM31475.1 MAG: porin [Paraburkholderia sp.]
MRDRKGMSKKRLVPALTVAGLLGVSGAAQAQSSVTLYGIVDGSILYTSRTATANGGHQFSMTDSGMTGSSFGMRGSEDLGGGMRAIFELENGFSVANGQFNNSNGGLFGRQAWVGIDSKFGTVKAGVQYSPFFLALYDMDPRAMSYFGTGLVSYLDNVLITGLFNSNSITYTSPEIAGIQASGLMALGGTAGNFQAGRQYSASLRYHIGGLTITGAMYNGNEGGTAVPISTVAFVGRTLGASYRFPNDLAIYASYALYKVAGSFSNSVYSGGFSYFVKPYLNVNAGVWYTHDGAHIGGESNHSIMASSGVQFFLSKWTTLYGQVGYVNNSGLMNSGLSVNNALFGVRGSTVGASLGIRHMF